MTNSIIELKLTKAYLVQQTKHAPTASKLILAPMIAWGLEEQLTQYSSRFSMRENVARFYADNGFKVAQIAHKIGVSRVTVYQWLEWTEGKSYTLPTFPGTEELLDQWEQHRGIWTPIIYSKDIQIKL